MDMKIKIIGLIVILCLTLVMAPIQVFAGDASGSVSVGLDTGIGGIVMAPPMASPSPSTYTSAQSVTLSAPGSTGIYYTLNGFPASNTSTPYTSPINIAVTTTITCIAYYADANHTGVSAAYLYTINIPTSTTTTVAAGGGGGAPPPSGGGGNTVYGGTTNISGGINSKGVFTTAENCWSDDYQAVLYITAGVTGLTSSGAPLSSIGVVRMTTPPSFPAGSGMMGFAYDFTPAGATFNPGIQVRMPYNPSALPAGVSATSLQMSYYDSTLGAWVTVPTQVDTVNDFVWGTISHFTPYAITYGVKPVTAVSTTTSTTTTSVVTTLPTTVIATTTAMTTAVTTTQAQVTSTTNITAVVTTTSASISSSTATTTNVSGTSNNTLRIILIIVAVVVVAGVGIWLFMTRKKK